VQPALQGKRRLLIAPDEDLFTVPFAALRDRRSGRYVIQDFEIALVPSLALAAQDDEHARSPASLLVVADPTFDPDAHPSLPRLPGARREASEVAKYYPGKVVIRSGGDATAQQLLAEIGSFDVVHLAAHGLVHDQDPFRSRIVLAGGSGRGGDLTVAELARADFKPSQVVVLAVCDSSGGVVSRSEGPVGLAWPFLAQGVPAVVATLWAVDDAASALLLRDFHRDLAKTGLVETALRTAQQSAIAHHRSVGEWAGLTAFVMIQERKERQ
jgi:CHAT domain-containing protein